MRRELAAAIAAPTSPGPLPTLAPKPADNDNTIAPAPTAKPDNRNWRSTRSGGVLQRFAPALIIAGIVFTLAWCAALAWAVFRIALSWLG